MMEEKEVEIYYNKVKQYIQKVLESKKNKEEKLSAYQIASSIFYNNTMVRIMPDEQYQEMSEKERASTLFSATDLLNYFNGQTTDRVYENGLKSDFAKGYHPKLKTINPKTGETKYVQRIFSLKADLQNIITEQSIQDVYASLTGVEDRTIAGLIDEDKVVILKHCLQELNEKEKEIIWSDMDSSVIATLLEYDAMLNPNKNDSDGFIILNKGSIVVPNSEYAKLLIEQNKEYTQSLQSKAL